MRLPVCVILLSFLAFTLRALEAPIEPNDFDSNEKALLEKAQALKADGNLLNRAQVVSAIDSPVMERLTLPPASNQKLEPREIASKARAALLRIGWYYLEKGTNEWHMNLAGGYAITTDGAAVTCHHCVIPGDLEMREGYLVASDAAGNVYPVRGILAADADMDVAIVRVSGGPFAPVSLGDGAMPGDSVYCYSDPLGVAGYFTSGIVNRYFWREGVTGDAKTIEGARKLRVHVSTDWAPGSSGAAVLDSYGNSIGHVCSIESVFSDDEDPAPPPKKGKGGKPGKKVSKKKEPPPERAPMLLLHEAVTTRGVKMLLKQDEK
jgi:hypothetical protein